MHTLRTTLSYFRWPILVSVLVLAGVYVTLGLEALWIAFLLSVLEVTLSFDNAVVNAKVLQRMDEVWRKRFLTWGILFAVVGTRFVLPIIIVAITAATHPLDVLRLALQDPDTYGVLLTHSDIAIKTFGGMFLAMVALKYFVDDGKTIHWVARIERYLARLGSIESAEILIGLTLLLGMSFAVDDAAQATVLVSGLVGILLFLFMEGITHALSLASSAASFSGFALFIYLNVLDAAFSLDGVVGAFALTHNLTIIVVGLGIGAYLVRSMTLYFVQQKTLATIRYLEHGAHWAILGLAATMLIGLLQHVLEIVAGLVGLVFVMASYASSVRHIARQ